MTEKKIILRPIEERDMEILREMMNDPRIEYSTTGWNLPISTVMQRKWFLEQLPKERTAIRRMIEIEGEDTIGCIGLHRIDPVNKTGDISIKILRKFQGRNYPYRALELFGEYCFNEIGIYCMYGSCLDSNVATKKLVRMIGSRSEGLQRSAVYKNGRRHDLLHFSFTAEDFRRRT